MSDYTISKRERIWGSECDESIIAIKRPLVIFKEGELKPAKISDDIEVKIAVLTIILLTELKSRWL